LKIEEAFAIAERMTILKFYPQNPHGISEVALELACMCEEPEQAEWLLETLKSRYDEWPGPRTLRAVYCEKFKPADGKEATLDSR
jgi:hypothetical protein